MMKFNQLLVALMCVLLFACSDKTAQENEGKEETVISVSDDIQKKQAYIQELEQKVWGQNAQPSDLEAKKLLNAYSAFVNAYRDHEEAPEYMFNAGRLSSTLNKPRKAIELFTDVHDNFPGYKKRTEAAYLVAFIYDVQLNDREKAERAYEKVMELYPESPWAEDARVSINNLYKTDEELIREFEAKNKAAQ
jgi:tetratricopeptide (TPR) repeat protein